MRSVIWSVLVITALLSSNAVVSAMEMKFALSAPEKTPWTAHARGIAKDVHESTNGSIKINVFPSSQLGHEQEVIRQVARGRIQLGSFSNTAASLIVPEIALLAAPYLWTSTKQADCVLDNHLISVFQSKFVKKGLYILGWTEVGNMGYASKEPIRTLEELAGVKMRVAPTKASSLTADALGAFSISLPITDVASALQTGMVEGADLPGLVYTSLGFTKIAPNWTDSRHSHQVGVVVINAKQWKKLSADQQEALRKSQAKPEQLRQQVRGAEAALLKKFQKEGGNLISLTADEIKKWQSAGAIAREKLIQSIGGDAKDIFAKIVQAKAACGS